jgi:hypothetical protein
LPAKCAYALVCAARSWPPVATTTRSYDSNYGIAWVTVANGSGNYGNNVQFASYVVNIDSIVLTDAVGNQYTAMSTPEPVDFVKLSNIAELWGSATIPADTYVSATITSTTRTRQVSLLVEWCADARNGQDPPGDTALTAVSVTVNFDPANPLGHHEQLRDHECAALALDFDLAASNNVDLTTSPATVTAPFFRISKRPPTRV